MAGMEPEITTRSLIQVTNSSLTTSMTSVIIHLRFLGVCTGSRCKRARSLGASFFEQMTWRLFYGISRVDSVMCWVICCHLLWWFLYPYPCKRVPTEAKDNGRNYDNVYKHLNGGFFNRFIRYPKVHNQLHRVSFPFIICCIFNT